MNIQWYEKNSLKRMLSVKLKIKSRLVFRESLQKKNKLLSTEHSFARAGDHTSQNT
jgi:hypothetical protein